MTDQGLSKTTTFILPLGHQQRSRSLSSGWLEGYMSKKKKQRKKTQNDAEKILEEDKAYSTMVREEDF
jgi:formate-dependent phosphoribosylglycinamide formyltransferase (GAR transformylase)